tara:strand:- start:116 stop:277 length:162 start_codon:yes stop_codon:yes gene_type:complete
MAGEEKKRFNVYIDEDVMEAAKEKGKEDQVPSISWLVNRLLGMYNKGLVKPLK